MNRDQLLGASYYAILSMEAELDGKQLSTEEKQVVTKARILKRRLEEHFSEQPEAPQFVTVEDYQDDDIVTIEPDEREGGVKRAFRLIKNLFEWCFIIVLAWAIYRYYTR